jgi:hypothetical protein
MTKAFLQVQELLAHRTGKGGALAAVADPNAVEVFGLQKYFPGSSFFK